MACRLSASNGSRRCEQRPAAAPRGQEGSARRRLQVRSGLGGGVAACMGQG